MNLIRRLFLAAVLMAGLSPAIAQVPAPVPALPDSERRTSYSISGTTCSCNVNFALFGDGTDFANWVEVFINGVLYDYNDATHGWTITSPSGALSSLARPITNAVLTFNAVQTGTVQIVGARRPRRTAQFAENTGVSARNLNQVLTDIISQNREIWDKTNDVTGRSLLGLPGESISTMPAAATRAGKFLYFDATGLIPQFAGGTPGTGTVIGPPSSTVGHVAKWDNTSGTLLADGGTYREQLTAARDYYVRTDGNDNNNGLTNTAGGAFLTVQKCITTVEVSLDLNGQNVQCRIQGMGTSATYTGDILQGQWVGYTGNGFSQFTMLCENGTVTLAATDAGAVIFATQSGPPVRWKGCTTINSAASGIQVEADDGGFIVFDTHTFAATGAGGIQVQALLGSRILFMAGTHTISGNSGVWAYATNNSQIIFQPGTTIALGAGRTMSTSLVYVQSGSKFENTGLSFTGTLGGSAPYNVGYNTFASISDASILSGIGGAGAAVATPISPATGGTGVLNNPASTLTISGNFGTTFTVSGATSVTLPTTGTLATLAGSEELTNKTLTSSVGKGTWTASGTWTLPALTLGGTISGGGNPINNVIIGASNPLAATFTTINGSGDLSITKSSGVLSQAMTASASQVQVNYIGNGGVSYFIKDTNAGVDQKFWRLNSLNGATSFAALTDAGAVSFTFKSMNHSTGQTSFPTATASTSSVTGGVIMGGGLGVAGAIWAGTYINITPTVVNSLPACAAGTQGARSLVTNNATAVAFNGAVTTGGANITPVFCDGTNWKQGALEPANDNFTPNRKFA